MIYKNDIKVKKIEIRIDHESNAILCHAHLSNDKVFTGMPEKLSASVMYNQKKLETITILALAKTLKELKKEMKGK